MGNVWCIQFGRVAWLAVNPIHTNDMNKTFNIKYVRELINYGSKYSHNFRNTSIFDKTRPTQCALPRYMS